MPALAQAKDAPKLTDSHNISRALKAKPELGGPSSSDPIRVMRAGRSSTLSVDEDGEAPAGNNAPHPLAAEHPDQDVIVCIAGCTPGAATIVSMRPRATRATPEPAAKSPDPKVGPSAKANAPAITSAGSTVHRALSLQPSPARAAEAGSAKAAAISDAEHGGGSATAAKGPVRVSALMNAIVCVAGCASPWAQSPLPSTVAATPPQSIPDAPPAQLAMTPLAGKQIRQAFRAKIIDSGAATAQTSARFKPRRTAKRRH